MSKDHSKDLNSKTNNPKSSFEKTEADNQDITFLTSVKMILALITKRDKIILFFLLWATLLLTIIETIGVTVIMPFISLATNPDLILLSTTSSRIFEFLGFEATTNFMLFFCFILILFYFFRAIYNLFYVYVLNRFVYRKYHYFSYWFFCNTIKSDYQVFAKKNLDDIRKGIIQESLQASQFLSSFLNMFSEVSVISILYVILLFISWKMTLILTFFLGVNILFITKGIKRAISKQGKVRQETDKAFFKIISQSLSNFKILKLRAKEEENFEHFEKISINRSKVQTLFNIFLTLPRNILETMGFSVLVAAVAYVLYFYGDARKVLPIVSIYALALYKVLPSVSKILDSYNVMIFNMRAVKIVYDALQEDVRVEGNKQISFKNSIKLSEIDFKYEDKLIFDNFNLEIMAGEKVAFVGKSGVGKSTLIDLIIGILHPTNGKILIDNVELNYKNIRSWRSRIGYIPQDIYLFSGSVGENIAFGDKIDKKRLIEVTKMANIYDFLEENGGFDMNVGDGGNNLSGGQRQRIGIARALYHNPDVLVLDEATSALDLETEEKIMDEIYEIAKDKTLLIIAHRLSTINRCDRTIVVG